MRRKLDGRRKLITENRTYGDSFLDHVDFSAASQVIRRDHVSRPDLTVESFRVDDGEGSTIMILGPICDDFLWSIVGLRSVYRVGTRSTLHNPETLHGKSGISGRFSEIVER